VGARAAKGPKTSVAAGKAGKNDGIACMLSHGIWIGERFLDTASGLFPKTGGCAQRGAQ
jgi:hypothetical protein